MKRDRGTVKFFNRNNGWGYITPTVRRADGKDVFVHKTELRAIHRETVHEGDIVLYVLRETPKGPRAYDLEIR